MDTKCAGASLFFRDVKAGQLFAYRLEGATALALRLADNAFQMSAVALTHPPSGNEIPSLVSMHFFDENTLVLGYASSVIHVDPGYAGFRSGEWPLGAFIAASDGDYLSCARQGHRYIANFRTGELRESRPSAFWTSSWEIRTNDDRAIYAPPQRP